MSFQKKKQTQFGRFYFIIVFGKTFPIRKRN